MSAPVKSPFTLAIRVPYGHTDQMGFVYYAHYFLYFEMARTELLRAYGVPYASLEARDILLPVLEARCTYHRPARYDDRLAVEAGVGEIGPVRFRLTYTVRRDTDLLAEGYTDHACVSRRGRPQPLDSSLREVLERIRVGGDS